MTALNILIALALAAEFALGAWLFREHIKEIFSDKPEPLDENYYNSWERGYELLTGRKR